MNNVENIEDSENLAAKGIERKHRALPRMHRIIQPLARETMAELKGAKGGKEGRALNTLAYSLPISIPDC